MKLRSKVNLLVGAIALASTVYMPQASAAVYNLGTLSVPASVGFSGYLTSAGSFSDEWTFKVDDFAALVGTGNSFTFSKGAAGATITGFDLYKGASLVASGAVNSGSLGFGITSYSSMVSSVPFTAGESYSLKISGVALSAGANYGASLSTAPVPEPEEWAMMMVGAGLVGYQVRRKQKGLSQSSLG